MKSQILEATKEYIVKEYSDLFPITTNHIPKVVMDKIKIHYKDPNNETIINALNNMYMRMKKK